ncbi:MAG: sigma-70 family RNA polymerase sigma factor [Calditrichaeota bacterium]|nr:sigma-70 family RNA polymerase sigma factor [Calditrichota bacterium]
MSLYYTLKMTRPTEKFWIDIFREDREQSWKIFLERYGDLVRKVINRFVSDQDDRMELYTYTLDQLRMNDYHKLQSYFNKKRVYDFETWIAVVVRNSCMDWFRKKQGRTRLLKCIKELPRIDQFIFTCRYRKGYSHQTILEIVKTRFGDEISEKEFGEHMSRINLLLEKNSRWKLKDHWHKILPDLPLNVLENNVYQISGGNTASQNNLTPEDHLLQNASKGIIQDIFRRLPSEERIIIQLHFYRNMTLQEIARLLKMKNIWKVHRKLHKALEFLQQEFKKHNIDSSDLSAF